MSYLIVVAHPDDEVLGAGATMYKLSQSGTEVNVCILSYDAQARWKRPDTDDLHCDTNNCMSILGVSNVIKGYFPNIEFNTIPHLKLVQFIENAIIETKPQVVITHHPADLNNDHLHTSIACQAAVRLFQRRNDISPLKEFMYMEIPSATDWSLNKTINQFAPNTYFEIGEDCLKKSLKPFHNTGELCVISRTHGVQRQ